MYNNDVDFYLCRETQRNVRVKTLELTHLTLLAPLQMGRYLALSLPPHLLSPQRANGIDSRVSN